MVSSQPNTSSPAIVAPHCRPSSPHVASTALDKPRRLYVSRGRFELPGGGSLVLLSWISGVSSVLGAWFELGRVVLCPEIAGKSASPHLPLAHFYAFPKIPVTSPKTHCPTP